MVVENGKEEGRSLVEKSVFQRAVRVLSPEVGDGL